MSKNKSYTVVFNNEWARQYDSLGDVRHDLIGGCILDYNQFDELYRKRSLKIEGLPLQLIVAFKYRKEDIGWEN